MFIRLLQSIVTIFYKYAGFSRSKAYSIYLIYTRKKNYLFVQLQSVCTAAAAALDG